VQTRLLTAEFLYDGSQLRSGWIAETAGVTGDAAVAFLGPCDVSFAHMADRVDLEAGARIASPRMVHFIVEHPGLELAHITTRQRLLMALALELLNAKLGEALLHRDGDDLYLRGRKLSISVATVSPTSGLIHSAFNVRGEGAPVPAIGLEELATDPRAFAEQLLAAYAAEVESAGEAAGKVKRVG
jgi:uncharacterized protein